MADVKLKDFDPRAAIRPGTFDPRAIWALWCLRKTFFPLLWVGLITATIAFGDPEAISTAELGSLDSPAAYFRTLLSPLGGIALAIGLRLVTGILALIAAFPLASANRIPEYSEGWRFTYPLRLWRDRMFLASAFRAQRWTWAVRHEAKVRLGDSARPYVLIDIILNWANPVLVITWIVVTALYSAPS